eukprot:scaffold18732_cov30-Tisochrysis_lutea.AAC.1
MASTTSCVSSISPVPMPVGIGTLARRPMCAMGMSSSLLAGSAATSTSTALFGRVSSRAGRWVSTATHAAAASIGALATLAISSREKSWSPDMSRKVGGRRWRAAAIHAAWQRTAASLTKSALSSRSHAPEAQTTRVMSSACGSAITITSRRIPALTSVSITRTMSGLPRTSASSLSGAGSITPDAGARCAAVSNATSTRSGGLFTSECLREWWRGCVHAEPEPNAPKGVGTVTDEGVYSSGAA